MFHTLATSVRMTLVLALLCCGFYPGAVTGLGQLIFPRQALGGFVESHGRVVGAHLIGQNWSSPGYFQGRPSTSSYDAMASGGSNLGPTSQKLIDSIHAQVEVLLKNNPSLRRGDLPTELATASASGLDPHLSPAGALAQVERVARERKIGSEALRSLIAARTEGPWLGLLGEPVVNVLDLNLDLERLSTHPTHRE
jgi:K+-transporting ATPase ATPase C chain